MIRVALIGGSYNPPHVGHLLAAHFVHAIHPIDQVWLMPAFRHPFGKVLVDFEHRLKMCEILCAGQGSWMKPTGVERELQGEGRTVDTLTHLTRAFPDHGFTLVIGSDIVPDLPAWKDFDRIQALAEILVLHRPGYPSPLAVGPALADVSSTAVRRALEEGELPKGWVPTAVLEYLRAHRLYRR